MPKRRVLPLLGSREIMKNELSMKKYKIELLIIFIISIGLAILLPNFAMANQSLVMPERLVLIKWTTIIFVALTLLYFAKKGKRDKEPKIYITNGYHELYNYSNQISKKGMFEGGKLYNGTIYVYKKDGSLSHTEIYKEGNILNPAPQHMS